MNPSPLLEAVCARLAGQAHTILLYGSRADGTDHEASDYDIAAFGPGDQTVRDARVVDGEFLDVFLYPESVLANPSADHLKLRQSRVLLQRGHEAADFLAALDAIYRAGPPPLPIDEALARRAWAWKMLLRLERGDVEAHYRRAWLLTMLLEDYFHLRGEWFEGPKKSLRWLSSRDPATYGAFEAALQPGAAREAIRQLVERVVGDSPVPGARQAG